MKREACPKHGQHEPHRADPAALPHPRISSDVPIETKLHAPNPRPEWVNRPELFRYLAGTTAGLILVSAPAGFGKTVLIAQWRSSMTGKRPFAWVSLDRGDDDPGRLWWYVVTALHRAHPEFAADDILRKLRAPAPGATGAALPVLADRLAALAGPVTLVLDGYHVIKDRACHKQVKFLLRHLPPQAQVVIITRADPPLPMARMRAAGEMVEILAHELRFTAEQAAELMQTAAGVQLCGPDLAGLVERTEGWPAGVYLAALSLRGHPSPHSFVRQFTGDNRFIVDFLAEEVLGRQPAHIRQFLARTSILARFSAPLCDAVTGSSDAAGIIEVLKRENLFIVPLDDNREWYRYHYLFARVLRSQLAITEPGLVSVLHERASAWYQFHGPAGEAIDHAIVAGDFALATGLIASCWLDYVETGQVSTVQGWLHSLGDDWIAANPVAAHCAAWAAALSGKWQTARRWLPIIDEGQDHGPLPDGIQSLESSAALLRAVYGFESLHVMLRSAITAAELEQDTTSPWHALARAALGFGLYLCGEYGEARLPLEEAVRNEACLPWTRIVVLSTLSLIAVEMGQLPEAAEFAREARSLTERDELSRTASASLAFVACGAVHAARSQFTEARSELEHALQPRQGIAGTSLWPAVAATLLLAEVLVAIGDLTGALELANQARDVLTELPDGAETQLARLAGLDRRIAARHRLARPAESLTEREVTVLGLLGGALTVRQIGQQLFLSENTIKTHIKAIYSKTGVSTRHDAVEQARQQGILP